MIVETESGSIYELDLVNNTVQRVPGKDSNKLRKDEAIVPLLRMPNPPTVGEPMLMYLDIRGDGIETLRGTTPVTSITP